MDYVGTGKISAFPTNPSPQYMYAHHDPFYHLNPMQEKYFLHTNSTHIDYFEMWLDNVNPCHLDPETQ